MFGRVCVCVRESVLGYVCLEMEGGGGTCVCVYTDVYMYVCLSLPVCVWA